MKIFLASIAAIFIIISVAFIRGYVIGYDINIFYINSVLLNQAETLARDYKARHVDCHLITWVGENKPSDEYVCNVNIKTNPFHVDTLLSKIKNEKIVKDVLFERDTINRNEEY